VAVSATGSYLYVADTWNCRIRAVDLRVGARYGRAVQVDPIKPELKAPKTQRLKL
jgi:sugar lactone lactonase YvrE